MINIGRDDDEVNQLVEMIDKLMTEGDGHLSIEVDENADGGLHVKTYRTSDCGTDGKSACCQPTEEDAVDNKDDY